MCSGHPRRGQPRVEARPRARPDAPRRTCSRPTTRSGDRAPAAAIDFSIELGKVICVPDPAEAAARDEAMAAAVDRRGVARCRACPGIAAGLVHPDAPLAGELFPQADLGGRWFDDVHGVGWRLVTDDPAAGDLDRRTSSTGSPPSVAPSSTSPTPRPTSRPGSRAHDVALGAAATRLPPVRHRDRCSPARTALARRPAGVDLHGGLDEARQPRRPRSSLVLADGVVDVATTQRRPVRPRPDDGVRRLARVRRLGRRRHRRRPPRSTRPKLRCPVPRPAAGVRHRAQLPQPRRGVRHGRPGRCRRRSPSSRRRSAGRSTTSRSSATPSTGRSSSSPSSAREADHVDEADAWGHVAGLTVGQDVSDRTLQFAAGMQFSLGKSRRGYGPMGPWVVTARRGAGPRRPRPRLLGRRRDRPGRPHERPHLRRAPPRRRALVGAAAPARRRASSRGRPRAWAWRGSRRGSLQPGQVLESWIEGIGTIRNRCVTGMKLLSPVDRPLHRPDRPRHAPLGATRVRTDPPHVRLRVRPHGGRSRHVRRVLRPDRRRRAPRLDAGRRSKAKAVARNPKVSLCILDERWPFTFLQVYADAVARRRPRPRRRRDDGRRRTDGRQGR